MNRRISGIFPVALVLAAGGLGYMGWRHTSIHPNTVPQGASGTTSTGKSGLSSDTNGTDWAAYGGPYGEQHFSTLDEINDKNISRLGLLWSIDLGPGNPATIPIAVYGILYYASGLSVVHAVDAATGQTLWTYDPGVAEAAGLKLRQGWGSRGLGYWNGKLYVGTGDGRLIAIDAKSGKLVWSTLTVDPNDGRYITGAPRLFDGKVIVGHGGSDSANIRGYVTTYDADTGKQLWRFYVVPGNPANGFEDEAQALAAKTWHGEWWKYGGGGAAWNAFTYDADTNTIFVGTGNGGPWNHKIRSKGKGDNLFVCSVVALDADTGKYKWHYQFNPGETWDYNAAMDMHLANLSIDGQKRKVLMTAPKNGFFYTLDRVSGKLLSAEKIAKVTWASKIDLATGRPVENPAARFPKGSSFEVWPGATGAHSWMPSAFSPKTGLAYIPKIEAGAVYTDRGIDLAKWKRTPGNAYDFGLIANHALKDPMQNTSSLLAWDPVRQKVAWEVPTFGKYGGGIMATGGNLVFQGQANGKFNAFAADSGKPLWSFDSYAAIIAAPITYRAGGHQLVTILVGLGTSPGLQAMDLGVDTGARTQAKRVLTFAIGGTAKIPVHRPEKIALDPDPGFKRNPAIATKGAIVYAQRCLTCHGVDAKAAGVAPDLRMSPVPLSAETFNDIVHGGALVPAGMPRFEELNKNDVDAIRQYLRTERSNIPAKK
ncbi:MAG: PQQ-dependent dehydrogenase, methanol/ethanol family [Alphaproteobacteria bacterium]|nr:PQQ-dependent dehydrogenase, methanol/ethanol family [Alphaproteobacteria bacterium]